MPAPQNRAAAAARSLEGDALAYALEITHPSINPPIRVVADANAHTIDGNAYSPLAFQAELPQEKDGEIRQARLQIDNIGRELMQWVELSDGGRGAMVRVIRVIRPQGAETQSEIDWELTMACSIAEANNQHVSITLTQEPIFDRPSVLLKHDPVNSPGLF